jgi:hypothetical protein
MKIEMHVDLVGYIQLFFILCKIFNCGDIAGWNWWLVFSPSLVVLSIIAIMKTTILILKIMYIFKNINKYCR